MGIAERLRRFSSGLRGAGAQRADGAAPKMTARSEAAVARIDEKLAGLPVVRSEAFTGSWGEEVTRLVNEGRIRDAIACLDAGDASDDLLKCWRHFTRATLMFQLPEYGESLDGALEAAAEFEKSGLSPGMRTDKFGSFAKHVGRVRAFLTEQRVAVERGIPLILVTGMQKAASQYLSIVVRDLLDVPLARACVGSSRFPVVVPSFARDLALGGASVHGDVLPFDVNVQRLADNGVTSAYVQFRDPRQAAVSMAMFKLRPDYYFENHEAEELVFTDLGKKDLTVFGGVDRISRRDYVRIYAAHVFEAKTEPFVSGWWKARDLVGDRMKIEFAEYRELLEDPLRYCRRALDLAGAPYDPAALEAIVTARQGKKSPHFRSGEMEEFRRYFTEAECADMLGKLPADLPEVFGWKP